MKLDKHILLLTAIMVISIVLILNSIKHKDTTEKPYDRMIVLADSYLYNSTMNIGMLELTDDMTISQVKILYMKGKSYPYFRGMVEPMVDRICQG